MPLQITTYGNGPIITGILQGIANITSSSDYSLMVSSILAIGIVLGIFGYHKSLHQAGSAAHGEWIPKAVASLGIFWMLTGASLNVFVYDPLNSYTGVANNVPLGIAVPYYLQNQISENLSTLYGEWLAPSGYASEFSYDNPNNGAGFYNPGMASPLQAINEAMKANPPDMYFQETMTGFGKDCMVPALLLGVVNPNDLYTSSNIEDLISTDIPNLPQTWTTEIYSSSSPGGITYSCSQAWAGFIKPDIDNFSGQSSGSNGSLNNVFADKFNTATNSNQNALADTLLLGNAASYMFNFSITGQQMLAQAAMMNSIGKGIMQFSESTGTSNTAQSYALTQAMSQSQSSWTTSAIIAAKLLPIFHLIMEVIVIALFPLFFALAVIPTMTGKYLKLLFELLMWLAMWSPIASIINYAVNFYMQAKVFVNINNPLSGTAGFNLANYNFIAQNSYTYTAITGAMMWMIPVLSFGLVTGSAYVISGAISAAQGTAHGAAQQQGAQTGTSSGLQGIGSQAGSLAGMQSEEKQGYNPAQAAEKIAGMSALDNLTSASAFGNNLQTNGLQNMINAKTNNMASTLGSGNAYSSPQQAYQTGMNSTFDKLAQQGITNDWAKMAGINYLEAANQLAQGKGFDVSGMYEMGKNGPIKISDNGHTHFTLNPDGKGILASATGQTTLDGQQVKTDILSDKNGISMQTYKGEHLENISATGNMALSSIHNDTPLGQVIGNSFDGKYSEGGGKFELNGILNKAQAQRLIDSGLIKGQASAELQSAINSGEQSFNIVATGNKNSITGLDITNKQGATIATDGNMSNLMKVATGYSGRNGNDQKNYYGVVENKYGPSYDYGNVATSGLTGYIASKVGTPISEFMDKNSIAQYNAGLTSKNPGRVQYTRSQIIDAGAKIFGQSFKQPAPDEHALAGELGIAFKNETELGFKLFGSGDKAKIEVTAGGKIIGSIDQRDLSEASIDLYKQKAYDSFAKYNPTTVQQAKGLLLANQAGANVTMITSAEGIIKRMLSESANTKGLPTASDEKGEPPYDKGRFGPISK
jgi:hypothetical protein